jgi:hypothetical protein
VIQDVLMVLLKGLAYGAIGGIGAIAVIAWSPRGRAMRRRQRLAFRSALACNTAIVLGDRLAALTHSTNTITYLENKDPKTIDEWLAEMDLDAAERFPAKSVDEDV